MPSSLDPRAASPANSGPAIDRRVALGRITWTGPLLLATGRSGLILLAQALAAGVFALRGHPAPWRAAAPWWTVYGTLVDLGCLALMWRFTRAEGITIRDLIGAIRLPRDILAGLGYYCLVFPFFVGGGLLSAKLVYGNIQPDVPSGLIFGRVLPLWGVVYSLSVFWMIWSPTEEMTYQAYALPRIQALSGRTWVAMVVVGFWWALQHSFLPFLPDWRCVLWRFLAFVPGVIVFMLVYLKTRRLPPLIVAHWPMDIVAALMTLQW
jgi:membrane protease YdiL (CAAX protease family)